MRESVEPNVSHDEDIWLLYGLEEVQRCPCNSARRFLWYLASPSARRVSARMNPAAAYANMTIHGPIADEAIYPAEGGEGDCLTVEYKLTKDEVWGELTGVERQKLISLVREKGDGFPFDLFCRSLRVARVI